MIKKHLLQAACIFVVLTACASPSATQPVILPTPTASLSMPAVNAENIMGINWQWESLDESLSGTQTLVAGKEKYTLTFLPDGLYTIQADCNTASGKYAIEGNTIIMLPGEMTLAACAEDSLSGNFLNLLGDITTLGLDGTHLTLVTSDGNTRLVFYNAGIPAEPLARQDTPPATGPKAVHISTTGLPYTAFPALMDASPYDPALPSGLPEHIEVVFSTESLLNAAPNAPVIYILPRGEYEKLWDLNGDASVTGNLIKLESLLAEKPEFPPFGMPILPFERTSGVNDLVAQGAYLNTPLLNGLRFIGQFTQNETKSGLFYIFTGLTADGQTLVSFFYPLTNADPTAPQPDLATLDAVITSLQIDSKP